MWVYTGHHELRAGYVCLDSVGDGTVKLWTCHGLGGNQEWLVTKEGRIQHQVSGQCLVVWDGDSVGLEQCGVHGNGWGLVE